MPSHTPCLCTRVLLVDGQTITARGWEWQCPSCGANKRRAIAAAAEAADARRIVTLTLKQPHAVDLVTGLPTFPAEHLNCEWESHVGVAHDGTLRWRTIPTCRHCLRRVSDMLTRWRKRLRRRWSGVEYLRVYETHKRGGLHVHVLVVGLPRHMSRNSHSGRELRSMWSEVGGGFTDVGRENGAHDGHRQAGGYAAKYLTKAAARPIRRGYRVWSRTRSFGPSVTIPGSGSPRDPEAHSRLWGGPVGWLNPYTGEMQAERPSLPLAAPAPT